MLRCFHVTQDSIQSGSSWFNDVIGFALLAIALLLLVAQFSFDRYDLAFIHTPPNKPSHNWIGPFGAYIAYASFFIFGLSAYIFPFLVAAFGLGYIFNFLAHFRERSIWSIIWAIVLLLSLCGLFDIMDGLLKSLRENIGSPSAGGWLGQTLYDFKLFGFDWGFWAFGAIGATIIYAVLCIISLLFLTNFRLGLWIRAVVQYFKSDEIVEEKEAKSAEEIALERRAKDLEKQAQKLQEEVARSGLGADLQPVPEPTVRDLERAASKVNNWSASAQNLLCPNQKLLHRLNLLSPASKKLK
ncbi:MAG: DNA translocase FtsK 4TM domain-containing protein [Limisphaerales bacterium]